MKIRERFPIKGQRQILTLLQDRAMKVNEIDDKSHALREENNRTTRQRHKHIIIVDQR